MGRVNAAELDAVTIDAYGTLVTLRDPIPALTAALVERNVTCDQDTVVHGFRTEVAHYAQNSASGHDEAGLRALQRDCAQVFLDAIGADLDADEFAPVYAAAMHFDVLPGVLDALERLRGLGLDLAVVANWDLTLQRLLAEIRLAEYFRAILHASGKPSPDGLLRALEQLGIEPSRALHIGDDEVDELAAGAAGVRFAAAPLPGAVATLA